MIEHILNRSLPPAEPKPAGTDAKLTPEQATVRENLRRTKAAEAVHRAIARKP
ncbi:MAG: hypothetical protein ACRC67_33195 [Inquilinus sp.]|uniref:hypothetical protein n=1 Tax=Inquilinus sp. TaxID=1932117 RepID=UPI003F2AD89C